MRLLTQNRRGVRREHAIILNKRWRLNRWAWGVNMQLFTQNRRGAGREHAIILNKRWRLNNQLISILANFGNILEKINHNFTARFLNVWNLSFSKIYAIIPNFFAFEHWASLLNLLNLLNLPFLRSAIYCNFAFTPIVITFTVHLKKAILQSVPINMGIKGRLVYCL